MTNRELFQLFLVPIAFRFMNRLANSNGFIEILDSKVFCVTKKIFQDCSTKSSQHLVLSMNIINHELYLCYLKRVKN